MTLLGVSAQADDGLAVTETLADDSVTPVDLADTLLPTSTADGIELIEESVVYTGADAAAGVFEGEIQATATADPEPGDRETFGFEDGIILSTGRVEDVEGPNDGDASTNHGEPGDEDLEALEGVGTTNNAAVLEFAFNVPPGTETVGFNYLFGSVEYNNFVFDFNDVFAFFVNGTEPDDNAATVPPGDPDGQPTQIDTVNHGRSSEDPVDPVNPELYVNNDPFNGDDVAVAPTDPPGPGIGFDPSTGDEPYDTEMDGFSVELGIVADVDPDDNPQEIKIAVADEIDGVFDTWVLLEAGSFEVDPDTGPAVRVEGDNVTITDTTVTNETVSNDTE